MDSADKTPTLLTNSSITQAVGPSHQSDEVKADQLETVLQVAFNIIAGSAFVLNLMFCSVLLKELSMMKKPYNTLLFNLAVTDLITGEITT